MQEAFEVIRNSQRKKPAQIKALQTILLEVNFKKHIFSVSVHIIIYQSIYFKTQLNKGN